MWTLRSIKARYKQTFLGAAWAVIQPLGMTLVFALIFSIFVHIDSGGVPYPIFLYVALLPWTFFAMSVTTATPSLYQNMNLVTKIYFPREILPFGAVGATAVDFWWGAVVLVVFMLIYHMPWQATMVYLPLLLIIQIIFTLGVSLICSAATVTYRDVHHAVPLVIQIWMYATPIIYAANQVPERWQWLYMLNPMAVLINAYRQVVLLGQTPQWNDVAVSAVVSIVVFVIAYAYFKHAEVRFADII